MQQLSFESSIESNGDAMVYAQGAAMDQNG